MNHTTRNVKLKLTSDISRNAVATDPVVPVVHDPLEKAFESRRHLANSVRKRVVNISSCDLNEFIDDLKFHPSNSASETVILSGTLKDSQHIEGSTALKRLRKSINVQPNSVLLKISQVHSDLGKNNSVHIEQAIYKNVINKMLFGQITPHLIPYVTMFSCGDFGNALKTMRIHNKASAIARWKSLNSPTSEYFHGLANVMMLEMNSKGQTLRQFLKSDPPKEHVLSVIVQVFYTLLCFNNLSPPLRHNDLHFENILVDTVSDEDITYVLNESEAYRVRTFGNMAKIYDFDRSFNGAENTHLNQSACESMGMCNRENPYFDTFSALFNFMKTKKAGLRKELQVASQIADKRLFLPNHDEFSRPDLMCKSGEMVHDERQCNGEITATAIANANFPLPDAVIRNMTSVQPMKIDIATVDFQSPKTFFASKGLRSRLKAKFLRLSSSSTISPISPISPISEIMLRRYNSKCETSNWPSDHTNNVQVFGRLAIDTVINDIGILKMYHAKRLRDYSLVLDTIFGNIQEVSHSIDDVVKFSRIVVDILLEGYGTLTNIPIGMTSQDVTNLIEKYRGLLAKNQLTCTYDLIYKCKNFATTKQTRDIISKSADVETMLKTMICHPEYYRFSPEIRAQFIIKKVLTMGTDIAYNISEYQAIEKLLSTPPTSTQTHNLEIPLNGMSNVISQIKRLEMSRK
jgi:hypothetical protein